jgi:N utilization substance protein A
MARKKPARKKKTVSKKKPTLKNKPAPQKKLAAKNRKKPAAKKKPVKKASAKKFVAKPAAKKKSVAKKLSAKPSAAKKTTRQEVINPITTSGRRGLGAASGGQSGDTQGLSRRDYDDSESVEELMEEGQYMEAEAVSGVENAPDADQGEVKTRQFPEDDVPEEYKDDD